VGACASNATEDTRLLPQEQLTPTRQVIAPAHTALDRPECQGPLSGLPEKPMQIFIDSADLNEIRDCAAMGVIDGVTTNPSLIAKAGRPFETIIREICEVVDGPISAEVLSTDFDGIVREGRVLAKIHPNIVVKVPLVADGLRAVRVFSSEGIKTNVTLCFSATQGMLAAKAGATYISPFVGRVDDTSGEGMQIVEQLVTIYENYGYETQVLAASVRHPLHVVRAAELGAHVATIPHKVIHQLLKHPLTDIGLAQFLADAKKIPQT
jgi:transaldolase